MFYKILEAVAKNLAGKDWASYLGTVIAALMHLFFATFAFWSLWNLLCPKYFGLAEINLQDSFWFVIAIVVVFSLNSLSNLPLKDK